MDIEGLSEKTIGQLMDELGIKEIYDLYDLTYDNLINLDRFADKKTRNLLDAIEKSKNTNLSNFIYAIGIPNVGERSAKDLAEKFKTLDNLRAANIEQLQEVNDIGEITAKEIVKFFKDDEIRESLDLLLSKGIIISRENNKNTNKSLEGLTFVITGTVENYNRDQIKELIEYNGGKVTGQVSKNTDVLICGLKPGSKLDKAKKFSVEIYEDKQLYDFLEKLEGK